MLIIPGFVYRNKDIPNANKLSAELKIFPTPFKGIYYIPYETERGGWYVTDPHRVIFKAAQLYLKTDEYYFGLNSALYFNRIIWNAAGIDIINRKVSKTITRKKPSTKYWRGQVINKIMAGYPFPVKFHRIKDFDQKGVIKKGPIAFSNTAKTKLDAIYLCKKGDESACDALKILNRLPKAQAVRKKMSASSSRN
jgi:hypothetical protein